MRKLIMLGVLLSAAFVLVYAHGSQDSIERKVEEIDGGIRITITSDDPEMIETIQKWGNRGGHMMDKKDMMGPGRGMMHMMDSDEMKKGCPMTGGDSHNNGHE